MSLVVHAARQLAGTWRLIFSDRAALLRMDRSHEAFWRSFWAFVPSTLFLQVAVSSLVAEPVAFRFTTILAIAAVAALPWVLWPLAAWYLLDALGLRARYFDFIIVGNWTALVQIPFTFALFVLVALFRGSSLAVLLFGFIYLPLIFLIWWRAIQRSLGCERPVTFGVMAAQIGVGVGCTMIQQIALAFVGK